MGIASGAESMTRDYGVRPSLPARPRGCLEGPRADLARPSPADARHPRRHLALHQEVALAGRAGLPRPDGHDVRGRRREVRHLARGPGRVRLRVARQGQGGAGRGLLRRRDRADQGAQRDTGRGRQGRGRRGARPVQGRGHPAADDARVARQAQAVLQGGRHGHGRQLVADLGRRVGPHARAPRRRRQARAQDPRQVGRLGRRRRAAYHHGRRPGVRPAQAVRPLRHHQGRRRPV